MSRVFMRSVHRSSQFPRSQESNKANNDDVAILGNTGSTVR